jgi:hypothetical protein
MRTRKPKKQRNKKGTPSIKKGSSFFKSEIPDQDDQVMARAVHLAEPLVDLLSMLEINPGHKAEEDRFISAEIDYVEGVQLFVRNIFDRGMCGDQQENPIRFYMGDEFADAILPVIIPSQPEPLGSSYSTGEGLSSFPLPRCEGRQSS